MSNVAVVTGGTRGIGLAISKRLAAEGFAVACTYSSNEAAAKSCEADFGLFVVRGDVRSPLRCLEVVNEIEEKLGPVQVLVNNAGITRDAMMHRMTLENWQEVIDVNLNGVFNMSRAVIEGMRSRRYGRIVNISSINGQKGQLGQVNYTASKAALFGFTRSLAIESAALGITVNSVAPGYISTEMTSAMSPAVLDQIVAGIPVGRMGTPEEVAACVAFLVGADSGFVTGACVTVNGGQYMNS